MFSIRKFGSTKSGAGHKITLLKLLPALRRQKYVAVSVPLSDRDGKRPFTSPGSRPGIMVWWQICLWSSLWSFNWFVVCAG